MLGVKGVFKLKTISFGFQNFLFIINYMQLF